MKQLSLATTGFDFLTKRTRKRELLDEMNLVLPWPQLLTLIAPHAPAGKTGHPPYATEEMLRILLLQQFFGHFDPAMEEALHDIPLYREFAQALRSGGIRQRGGTARTRGAHALAGQVFAP